MNHTQIPHVIAPGDTFNFEGMGLFVLVEMSRGEDHLSLHFITREQWDKSRAIKTAQGEEK